MLIYRVKEYEVCLPLGRYEQSQSAGQVTVRVDGGHSKAQIHVMDNEMLKEGGFARPGLADDVGVEQSIMQADAEWPDGEARGVGLGDVVRFRRHASSIEDALLTDMTLE